MAERELPDLIICESTLSACHDLKVEGMIKAFSFRQIPVVLVGDHRENQEWDF
jgi:hypothetical protein